MPEKTTQKKQPATPVGGDWGQQILGGLIGALVVALAMQIGSTALGWAIVDRTPLLLAGAALGAILSSLDRFASAGARLTGKKEGRGARLLNVIVGVLGMLVLIGLVWVLVALVGWIARMLF